MLSTTITCLLALACPQEPVRTTPGGQAAGEVQPGAPGRQDGGTGGAGGAAGGTTSAKAAPEPGTEAATEAEPANLDLIQHAGLLPGGTLAAVSMPAVSQHRVALMKSGLDDLLGWVGQSWRKADYLAPVRLGPVELDSLWDSGFSLGVTGVRDDGAPRWLLLVPPRGRGPELRKSLALRHQEHEAQSCDVAVQLIGVDQAWTVTDPNGRAVSYAITNETIFVADSVETIRAALAQKEEPESSLRAAGSYVRFCTKCTAEGSPFLTVFTQPGVVIETGLRFLPTPAARDAVREILAELELDRVLELGTSFFAGEGKLRDFTWIGFPQPRSGLLAALLGGDDPITTDQLQAIAPDSISATLFSVDLAGVFARAMRVVRLLHPSIRGAVQERLDGIRAQSGLDVVADILPLLGTHGTVQEFATVDYTRVYGLTLQLRDSKRMHGVLNKLAASFGFQRGMIAAIPAFAIPDLLGAKSTTLVTIHENTLIIGSSPRFVHRVVSLLQKGVSGDLHLLTDPLTKRGPLPNIFSWGDCAGVSRHWMRTLSAWAGHRLIADELARLVVDRGGACTLALDAGDDGLELRSESPFGNLYLSLGAAYLVKLGELEAQTATSLAARRLSIVRDILAAQHEFHARILRDTDGDGLAEFGRIADLLEAGLVSSRWFPDPAATPLEAESYRFQIYTPKSNDGRETDFLFLAWPAPHTSGVAFAATANGSIYANKIIGQTGNLKLCDPRDFYAGGDFDNEILPAWALLESRMSRSSVTQAGTELRELEPEERAQLDILAAAQANGTVTSQVLALLDADSPTVVARAAFVLGSLRHRSSVQQLCEKVRTHPNVEVQRQAMSALCKIRDKQSIATSLAALTSPDTVVRTFAAKNLGYLHARNAVRKLLDVITSDPRPNAADRISAILALADIGDPSCLVPAAVRVKGAGQEDQKALVYLFQTLSPKLDAVAETETMLAVLDDESELLRRYAIQRLGVLEQPIAEAALQARLARETTLRPLIEVSLRVIREQKATQQLKDYVAHAGRRGQELWNSIPREFLYGLAGSGVLLLILGRSVRRRRNHSRAAERIAAMVAPSDDFRAAARPGVYRDEFDGDYDDGDYDDGDYEDGDHGDGDHGDDDHGDGDYGDGDYDDGDYDDGGDHAAPQPSTFASRLRR